MRWLSRLFAFLTLLLVGLVIGCDNSDPSEDPGPDVTEGEVSPDTRVVSAADLASLEIPYEPEATLLAFTGSGVEGVEPGDILAAAPSPSAPSGFLVRVIDVEQTGSNTTYTVEQASLEEALLEATVRISGQLSESDIDEFEPLLPGVERASIQSDLHRSNSSGIGIEVNTQVSSNVTISGSVSITSTYSLELEIDNRTTERIRFESSLTASSSLDVTARAQGSVGATVELARFRLRPIVTFVGLFPIVLVPTITITLESNGQVGAQLSTGAMLSAKAGAALVYSRQAGWDVEPQNDFSASIRPLCASGDARFDVGASTPIRFLLYGVTGPYLTPKAYYEVTANTSLNPWWRSSWGVDASAGAEVRIFGNTVAQVRIDNLIGFEEPLAQADGAFVECDEEIELPPPPPGNSNGDVHIRTPDGLAYDFQGAGEYLLMESSDGSVVVQSRQEPWRGSDRVTINTATAMNVAGDRVGVYLGRSPQLYINGVPTSFNGDQINLPNGGIVSDAAPGFLVSWPSGFLVSARPGQSFMDIGMSRPEGSALTYSGLLGNMNGDPADDLFTRGGGQLAQPIGFDDLYDLFGASWQIMQDESLFDYEGGASATTYAIPDFPTVPVTVEDLDPDTYQAARDACIAAGITNPVILDDCILDLALTGEAEFIDSAKGAPAPNRTLDLDLPDGLIGHYYDGYFDDDLSFFEDIAPLLVRVDNPIDFRNSPSSWDLGGAPEIGGDLETFSVIWKGRLIVPESGTYTLYLNSDDASYLFLGESALNPSTSNPTIDNGGAHPEREVSVELALDAGDYPVTLIYGEERQINVVQLFWSSEQLSIPKEIVTSLGRRTDS